jgi:hypothetical protein
MVVSQAERLQGMLQDILQLSMVKEPPSSMRIAAMRLLGLLQKSFGREMGGYL